MESLRVSILNRIITRGGLYAHVAEMHLNDEVKGNAFIQECFMQCHNPSLWKSWGIELILDIVHYRLGYLRKLHEEYTAYSNKLIQKISY